METNVVYCTYIPSLHALFTRPSHISFLLGTLLQAPLPAITQAAPSTPSRTTAATAPSGAVSITPSLATSARTAASPPLPSETQAEHAPAPQQGAHLRSALIHRPMNMTPQQSELVDRHLTQLGVGLCLLIVQAFLLPPHSSQQTHTHTHALLPCTVSPMNLVSCIYLYKYINIFSASISSIVCIPHLVPFPHLYLLPCSWKDYSSHLPSAPVQGCGLCQRRKLQASIERSGTTSLHCSISSALLLSVMRRLVPWGTLLAVWVFS